MKADWVEKKLGDVCEVVNGGTPKTGVKEYWGGEHLWITPAEMGKRLSPYANETARKITSQGLRDSSARLLPPNSVILSSRAPIGHLVINTKPMATNQGCKGLVPNDNLAYKYLFYFLQANVDLLNDLGSGATFKELSGGKLKEVKIPLAPLTEQQRIVAILDQAFEGIAKARANAEQNLQNARALFESHLQSVFTQRGEGWEVKTLNQITENLDSKRVPITKNVRSNGAYPYYGASGIVDYVGEYIFDDDLLLISEDGANLLARTYPIAFSISGKTWVNNHAHVLRFKEFATQKLVEFYLNSISLNDFVSGMAQPKLNQKMLNTIPIPFPPIEIQRCLVKKLDLLREETQRLEALYQRKIACLDELKKSLLQQAFAGEL
jgi:type I restriction enzyme S subunit